MHTLGNTITAQSTPDYDGWGWDTYWSTTQWIVWHKRLVEEYGIEKANEIWSLAWGNQGTLDHPYNYYKYDSTFVQYFDSQGIDVGWWGSKILTSTTTAVADTVEDVTNAVDNLSDGILSTSNVLKVAVPAALFGVGYYFYKNYIKGSKRIKIKGVTV